MYTNATVRSGRYCKINSSQGLQNKNYVFCWMMASRDRLGDNPLTDTSIAGQFKFIILIKWYSVSVLFVIMNVTMPSCLEILAVLFALSGVIKKSKDVSPWEDNLDAWTSYENIDRPEMEDISDLFQNSQMANFILEHNRKTQGGKRVISLLFL